MQMYLHLGAHAIPNAVDAAIFLMPLNILLGAAYKLVDITVSIWKAVWC